MPFHAAAVLRTLLVASALAGAAMAGACRAAESPGSPPPEASGRQGAVPAAPPRGSGHDSSGAADHAGAPQDRSPRDPDQDVIDHLDLIQDLELLQNLELFDTGAPGRK